MHSVLVSNRQCQFYIHFTFVNIITFTLFACSNETSGDAAYFVSPNNVSSGASSVNFSSADEIDISNVHLQPSVVV